MSLHVLILITQIEQLKYVFQFVLVFLSFMDKMILINVSNTVVTIQTNINMFQIEYVLQLVHLDILGIIIQDIVSKNV